ncbi:MAG: 50S ribosomal protein L3 [Candidatus Omnitrophota bacterium]
MIRGLLGKKIGMTQIFDENGGKVHVTVLEAGPCTVQEVKVSERDGYNAVQLGFEDTKEKRLKKPQREQLKARKLKPKRFVREIRCDEQPDVKVGDEVTNSVFQKGDYLDITGTSKGKGFQGGVKRHGWAGGKASHGSMFHRAPGSMGASSYPSRVVKGHNLPGHMGHEKTTVQNLQAIDIDEANNTVIVKGAVPGPNGSYLVIKYAKKKPLAPRAEKKQEEETESGPEEKSEE